MSQCTAKSKRSKNQCLKWAMRGRNTCHMHGGKSRGPITKEGKARSRQAVLRNGQHTKEALVFYAEIMALIQQSKRFLDSSIQN